MGVGKFSLFIEDQKTHLEFKNTLGTGDCIYYSSSNNPEVILDVVRRFNPSLAIIEVTYKFNELKFILKIIDEEILTACILIINSRAYNILDFISQSKVISYIFKPVSHNSIIQATDYSVFNYKRVLNYENKIKQLNQNLECRKIIEKAKWILVERGGLTEFEAYETIRKKSRSNRLPMKKIAEAIILTKDY